MATVRPTVFASVPRVLEKVYDGVHRRVEGGSALRRRLFHWAVEVGKAAAAREFEGAGLGLALGIQHALADRLVLAKIRAALGGRVRSSFCGGAALPVFVNEFFRAVGLRVQEAYGLTETSPVISVNGFRPDMSKMGSVGRVLPSYEVRLGADGELLVRGPCVFQGYWNKPEQTAEAFDEDGFFRTGDIAEIDRDGFVFITDRKKDLIVTAGGKNVAPQPIENRLKRSPFIDNAVLVGDGRPYIVALISPSAEGLGEWAAGAGLAGASVDDLAARPEVHALFEAAVAEVNPGLARFEQIKRFRVLPLSLSVESGHLTPTMKVKRRVVARDFADEIEALYREPTRR
jgi:long-chain acyl-CoA synthetase